MTTAIIITLWIVSQVFFKIYYIFYPEKAVMHIRDMLNNRFLAVIGYVGWGFLMLLAFYFAGLYNF